MLWKEKKKKKGRGLILILISILPLVTPDPSSVKILDSLPQQSCDSFMFSPR